MKARTSFDGALSGYPRPPSRPYHYDLGQPCAYLPVDYITPGQRHRQRDGRVVNTVGRSRYVYVSDDPSHYSSMTSQTAASIPLGFSHQTNHPSTPPQGF